MSEPYIEILSGETILRRPPGPRHELVCARLFELVFACVANLPAVRLLPPRTVVELAPGTLIRPDLTLITTATGKAWLTAEVIDSVDHSADTVLKKSIYEEFRMPRVWIVDPRYDNVEVYHSTAYGLSLKEILAHRDLLTEKLLPDLSVTMGQLFGAA